MGFSPALSASWIDVKAERVVPSRNIVIVKGDRAEQVGLTTGERKARRGQTGPDSVSRASSHCGNVLEEFLFILIPLLLFMQQLLFEHLTCSRLVLGVGKGQGAKQKSCPHHTF